MLLGIDIQNADRLEELVGTDKISKIFTAREIDYFQNKKWALETITGFFCAKEAFFKAVGTGVKISELLEVEILHTQLGAPFYHFSPTLIKEYNLSTAKINLSISHTQEIAVAVCVILKMIDIGCADVIN